ncbi:protein PHYLLO, chloroplastic-like [Camellia sinensis]|uniref:protein PHYLLO, chloroplastic-like n=1 Tax=Camellia sinensis TaxID=4442 RepID=UPI001036B9BF|nr:protein PHYLLO, chloroplastic-like [Camellia sinensis]
MLAKFTHSGVVVVVIKPSVVGAFENAALIASWAQQQGKMSVVSATVESSPGLSVYVQFSYYLELQKAGICMAMNKEPSPSIAHGLGNYGWLKEDITSEPLNICRNPCSGFIEAYVDDAGRLLGNFQVDNKNNVLVFLHGFLGTVEDWIPIMKAISGSARCIAVDLEK